MSDHATTPVSVTAHGDVAVITIDDGKANALSHGLIDGIRDALDGSADSTAVVIAGRPGRFSAGFDLTVMRSGPSEARELLGAGAQLALRILEHPTPTVAACTGHALAMGAILLLTFDIRVGTPGEFKIGMNEVAIGMPVPRFALELAGDRLSKRHLNQATQLAHIYEPDAAVDAGYLDRLADDTISAAIDHAAQLAGHVTPSGFRATRRLLRGPLADRVRDGLLVDLTEFSVDV